MEDHLSKQERQKLGKEARARQRQLHKLQRFGRGALFWSFLIVGLAGLTFAVMKYFSESPSSSLLAAEWVRGNNQSSVTLLEYSDFQCPACRRYYQLLKQLHQEFGSKIRFVFRHLPLRGLHANADIAARAAEAAGIQGKFWGMHDLLYENQSEWSGQKNPKDSLIRYAESLNLDVGQFKRDLNSRVVMNAVNKDLQSASRLGVSSTPSFFLNGQRIKNPQSYSDFRALFQQTPTPGRISPLIVPGPDRVDR